MLTHETLEELWQSRPYRSLRQATPAITQDGLALGINCVLCKRSEDGGLAVDGAEGRIMAMLSLAYGHLVPIALLDHVRNASKALTKGEETIANIHLSFAALPPIENSERVLKLLFQAEQLMDDGLDSGELLEGLGLLPEGTAAVDWRAFVKSYHEDQPRDKNGRWTDGTGAATQVADNRPVNTANDAQATDHAKGVTVTRGPDGSTIVSNYQSATAIAGKGEYRGECVSLVRELGNLPPTWEWRAGTAIKGPGDPPLAEGTIIATMDETGRYPQDGTPKHAAVFMGYVSDKKGIGMKIYDQYRIGYNREGIKPPRERTIYFDNAAKKQNNAYSYSVITTK